MSRTTIAGHYESAQGQAEIVYEAGSMYVTPEATFSATGNGADAIYDNGSIAVIKSTRIQSPSGHGVHIGPDVTGAYKNSPEIDFSESISDDAINVKGFPSGSSRLWCLTKRV